MNAIQEAIQSRWDARSLTSTVTGGLHFGDRIQKTQPYATHIEVSDTANGRSRNTRYRRNIFQIDIYGSTDVVGDYANSVVSALDNSESALTSPFALPSDIPGGVNSVRLDDGPTTEQEEDKVWRARMTFEVLYWQPQNLTPA